MLMQVVGSPKTITLSKNSKQVIIGGKQVSVQMATGGNKTLTLVQPNQTGAVGKIVCLPISSTTANSPDQPKLMIVSRPKQPTATIASTSFDSPATIDAALAALATEAGLIDPEPDKDTAASTEEIESESPRKTGGEASENVGTTPMEVASGLVGGSIVPTKLTLKGGRLRPKGGSRLPKNFKSRMGLFGGSKDEKEVSGKPGTTQAEADSTQTEEGDKMDLDLDIKSETKTEEGDKMDLDLDIKSKLNEIKQEEKDIDDASMNLNLKMEPDSEFDRLFTGESQKAGDNSSDEAKNGNVGDDSLTAPASATLDHSKEYKTTGTGETDQPAKDTWYTVGFVKGNSFDVHNYFLLEDEMADLTIDNLPDLSRYPKISLEPGTAYKFRVAAINSVGRGEWSETSAFKTYQPGYPGAPSAIKISRSAAGAHLSWNPPSTNQGEILEYSVYLAVKGKDKTNPPGHLEFVRVYCGPSNMCVVNSTSLAAAYLDTSTKAAIIFRIAARNDKGYGPATQVRWLQAPPSTNKPAKRPPDGIQQGVKKIKYEIEM